jgi:hypothetical protein
MGQDEIGTNPVDGLGLSRTPQLLVAALQEADDLDLSESELL